MLNQLGPTRIFGASGAFAAFALAVAPALAGSHLWVIDEVYSNADGTIQFVEMYNASAPNEINLMTRSVTSDATGNAYTFTESLPPNSTSDRHLLLATSGFAALPGAPAPDHLLPDGFFSTSGDLIQWHTYTASILAFGPGELPLDGVQSLRQDGSVTPATPTNWDGQSWALGPGAVSDGPANSPLLVDKLLADGSRLALSWESCLGSIGYHVIHGPGSALPAGAGQAFAVGGGHCGVELSPFGWTGVPDPSSDPSRLLWFLVVADDGGSVEGPWGPDGRGEERIGPSSAGSSGVCGMVVKNASNTCVP